jgi:hypothetical protein
MSRSRARRRSRAYEETLARRECCRFVTAWDISALAQADQPGIHPADAFRRQCRASGLEHAAVLLAGATDRKKSHPERRSVNV